MENDGIESGSGIDETEELDSESEDEKEKCEGGVGVVGKIPIGKSVKKTRKRMEELS